MSGDGGKSDVYGTAWTYESVGGALSLPGIDRSERALAPSSSPSSRPASVASLVAHAVALAVFTGGPALLLTRQVRIAEH